MAFTLKLPSVLNDAFAHPKSGDEYQTGKPFVIWMLENPAREAHRFFDVQMGENARSRCV